MARTWMLAVTLALSLSLAACSSNKKKETDDAATDETAEKADAGTDSVPGDGLDDPAMGDPQANADPGAAPSTDPMAKTDAVNPPAPSQDMAAVPVGETKQTGSFEPMPITPPPAANSADPMAALMPPKPAGRAPASMGTSGGDSGMTSYTVHSGDTLMKIAFETYGDLYKWKDIYAANRDRISNPNALVAGTTLTLEKPAFDVQVDRNGDKYLIKRGDTLGTISGDVYGTQKKWRKLWENNKQLIKDPNRIFAGFYLYYTMTPQERDEAERLKQLQPELKPQPLAEVKPVMGIQPIAGTGTTLPGILPVEKGNAGGVMAAAGAGASGGPAAVPVLPASAGSPRAPASVGK